LARNQSLGSRCNERSQSSLICKYSAAHAGTALARNSASGTLASFARKRSSSRKASRILASTPRSSRSQTCQR